MAKTLQEMLAERTLSSQVRIQKLAEQLLLDGVSYSRFHQRPPLKFPNLCDLHFELYGFGKPVDPERPDDLDDLYEPPEPIDDFDDLYEPIDDFDDIDEISEPPSVDFLDNINKRRKPPELPEPLDDLDGFDEISEPPNVDFLDNIDFFGEPAEPDLEAVSECDKDTFEDDAFLLAFKDTKSLKVHTMHATFSDRLAVKAVTDSALDFLERNSRFCDFKAKWVGSDVGYSLFRVITAVNKKADTREVICIKNYNYTLRDLVNEDEETFSFWDVGMAIEGLIISGCLNFGDESLEAKGLKKEEAPRIVIAHLVPTRSEVQKESLSALYNTIGIVNSDIKKERHIYHISSNDPFYVRLSSASVDHFDYSTFTHKARWKTLKKHNKNIEPLSECEFERVWLSGSDCYTPTYFKHMKKGLIDVSNIKYSLILSHEFLKDFFKLSNRRFDLSVRKVRAVEGAYQIALHHKDDRSRHDFTPAKTIDFSFDENGLSFKYEGDEQDVNLPNLISRGWTVDTSYLAWNADQYYHEITKGSLSQIVSHWLWVMLVDQCFNSIQKSARYIKSNGSFTSEIIGNAKVYTTSELSDFRTVKTYKDYNEDYNVRDTPHKEMVIKNSDYAVCNIPMPVESACFEVSNMSFKVGSPLFEVGTSNYKAGKGECFSLFLSGKNEGFFSKEGEVSYTLIKTDSKERIREIYCFGSIGSALKKIVSELQNSYLVQVAAMDQYDIIRSMVNSAKAYGCKIDIDFLFRANQDSWRPGEE